MNGLSFRFVETLPVEPLLTQEEAREVRRNLWSPDQLNDQVAAKIYTRPDVAEALRHAQLMAQQYPPVSHTFLPPKVRKPWIAFRDIATSPQLLNRTSKAIRCVDIQLVRKKDLSKVVDHCSEYVRGEGRSQLADLYRAWPKPQSEVKPFTRRPFRAGAA